MIDHCDYCGDVVPVSSRWRCSHCPALYCTGRCMSADFSDHSQVCSHQDRGHTGQREGRQSQQRSYPRPQNHPQPQLHPNPQPNPQPQPQIYPQTHNQPHPQTYLQPPHLQSQPHPQTYPRPPHLQNLPHPRAQNYHQPQRESPLQPQQHAYPHFSHDGSFNAYEETKVYNSRTFYPSSYSQSSHGVYYEASHIRHFPSTNTEQPRYDNANNSKAETQRSNPPVQSGKSFEPFKSSVPENFAKEENGYIPPPPDAKYTNLVTKSKPNQPTIEEEPIIQKSGHTVPPPGPTQTKQPQVAKKPAPVSRKREKIYNNLFSVLKSRESSSEEDSIEEMESEDSEVESVTVKKKSKHQIKESATYGNVLQNDEKKVPDEVQEKQSDQMTKEEKKRLKKQREKEKVPVKVNPETKYGKFSKNEKKKDKPKLFTPDDADNLNIEDAKDQKKKLKKLRQKEKAAETNQVLFHDYISSIEREVSTRNFGGAEALIIEAFKLNVPSDQSRVLYELRSKVFLLSEKYDQALKDLKKMIENNPDDEKKMKSALDCCMKTGNVTEFQKITKKLGKGSKFEFVEKAREKMTAFERDLSVADKKEASKCFSEAVLALSKCLKLASFSLKLSYRLAKVLALDKRPVEARETLKRSIKIAEKSPAFPNSAYSNLVLGICSFYEGNLKSAERQFLLARTDLAEAEDWYLRTSQMRTLEEAVGDLFEKRFYQAALGQAQTALKLGEGNEKFLMKLSERIANIHYILKDYESSRDYLTKVIDMDPRADESLFHRGVVLIELGDYEGAVRDLTAAWKLFPDCQYRTELSRAEKLLKKSLEQGPGGKDYYQILGVERSASVQTIKRAFKEKALKYHPDKHAHSPREVQEEMEKKMKELSQAYRCLSDDQKKKIYDAEDSSDEDDDLNDFFSKFFESMMSGGMFFHFVPPSQRGRRRK